MGGGGEGLAAATPGSGVRLWGWSMRSRRSGGRRRVVWRVRRYGGGEGVSVVGRKRGKRLRLRLRKWGRRRGNSGK